MNGQNNKKTSDLSWYLTRILVSWLGCLMLGEERGQPVIQTGGQSARKLWAEFTLPTDWLLGFAWPTVVGLLGKRHEFD